jgi:hypothetical protein
VWLATSPLLLAGVFAAHDLAYRLTGTPTGPAHDYLQHALQALLVLAVVGLLAAGLGRTVRMPCAWQLPVAALATFVAQEHAEQLVHTGELPWLLGSPAFLVGILLQLPFAFLARAIARRLLEVLGELPPRPARLPHALLEIGSPAIVEATRTIGPPLPGRGPPPLRDPR